MALDQEKPGHRRDQRAVQARPRRGRLPGRAVHAVVHQGAGRGGLDDDRPAEAWSSAPRTTRCWSRSTWPARSSATRATTPPPPRRRRRAVRYSRGGDDAPLDPAHLPAAPAREHAGGVVDLGDQHDLPARRRALEPGGVRGQRLLHRRDGAVRGADRDRRRHGRASRLVPARHGDADGVDPALRAALADRGAVLAVGGRLDAARPRLHLLLRRGRGLAGRRADRDRLHRRAGVGVRRAARSSAGRRCWPARSREGSSPSRPASGCRSCSAAPS